jgi:putative ABC transport system permease protein
MRHIVKPLFRHRLMPLLVVLQVAIACAIACNALFLLQQRLVPIMASDGVGHPAQLIMALNIAPRAKPWPPSRLLEVESSLRAVPGVTSVSVAGSLPMETMTQFNGDMVGERVGTQANAAVYIGDHLLDTLDLKLVAGRDFSATEQAVQYNGTGLRENGPAIVTQALADRLFPDGHALGQAIRVGKQADAAQRTVVGVVAHLMRNNLGQDNRNDIDYSMVLPGIPGNWPMPVFGVRVAPTANTERVRKAVAAVIERELGAEIVQGFKPKYEMYSSMRDSMLAAPRAAVWLLSGVSLVELIVALVGIMGLTGYWVQQRTRQIGVRRALGARRIDILRHVQVENLLVVGVGVLLGMLAAYGVNLWLMRHFELSRLPWTYLPYGAALMLVLGQLAVLAPARRAAAVPPVVATRSV